MHRRVLKSCQGARLRRWVLLIFWLLTGWVCPSWAANARSCPGGVAVITFKLLVQPADSGAPLPLTSVNVIKPGQKLRYEPVHLASGMKEKAKVAVVLVPEGEDATGHVRVLEEKPAKAAAEWSVPVRASVVGLIFGEHGIDEKKVNALVEKNPQVVADLTDYADKTSTVEALVQTLANYEQSAPGPNNSLQSVLSGFSAQYGTTLPTMDPKTPAEQQAALLMHAIVPAFSTSDSTGQHSLAMQSTGLASSLGSLFLGTPVTLAIGGAALLDNVHAALFPATDFRPAFTQSSGTDAMQLCTANQQKKAHTRPAYLWMLRVPDAAAPVVSLTETAHLPIAWQSAIKVSAASVSQLKLLPRARDWRLVSSAGSFSVPVKVDVSEANDTLTLDLRKAVIQPGEYKLMATWDWSPLNVAGGVNLHSFANFSTAQLSPESADRLVSGIGMVTVELTGSNFEFVDSVAIEDPGRLKPSSTKLSFRLPQSEQSGEQNSLEAEIDTASLHSGPYWLLLTQQNGTTHKVPIRVRPPNPTLDHLPLHANVGETEQVLQLHGEALERIERIASANASWTLAPVPQDSHAVTERQATIKLDPQVHQGDVLSASLFVTGMQKPLQVSKVIEVVGPRPKILNVKASFASPASVQVRDGEIPAGAAVSFALQVENVDVRPSVELACSIGKDTKLPLTLFAGQKVGPSSLDMVGDGLLFLSLDPGTIGQSGCNLMAKVATPGTGVSDEFLLGRVIDLPRIDKFTLTDDKLGDSLYAAILTGKNLQMIEKTGWDAKTGYPAQSIPTPVQGEPGEQTLKIAISWPAPFPRAPLYVWLRGETESRLTQARF